jgi:hypothetical protein
MTTPTAIEKRRFLKVMQHYKELIRLISVYKRKRLPIEEQQKMWMDILKQLDDDDFRNALEDLKQFAELTRMIEKEAREIIQPIIDKELEQRREDLR